MKVVSVGFMGVKVEFPHATFQEENGALVVRSRAKEEDGIGHAILAIFPAGKWDCAINEDREDIQPQTMEEQLKTERARTDDIAFAASGGTP